MTRIETDIFISGGGIAGLTAAASLAQCGFHVTLADPAPVVDTAQDPAADLRSTAFLTPAIGLLTEAGLWDHLCPHAAPLDMLRVVDSTGSPPQIRDSRTFRSDELTDEPFGWNIPNWRVRHCLMDALQSRDNVDLYLGVGFSSLFTRDGEARISLCDGTRLTARVALAADGRASPLREAAGIDVDITRYGQKALAFAVTHDKPHENISTEIYQRGGAFTIVPLPDFNGHPASAVVWMEDGPEATKLARLSTEDLSQQATMRSCHLLGQMRVETHVTLWPIVTQRAKSLTAQRVALLAESAHVLPPIGAQGLNTSLHDVRAFRDLARADPTNLGSPDMLRAYEKSRNSDLAVRSRIIDAFNRVCRSGTAPIQALRLLGLRAVHDITPLRRKVMRAGMGEGR